jgi:parvulin-like peptidyl-prolyl isomerase
MSKAGYFFCLSIAIVRLSAFAQDPPAPAANELTAARIDGQPVSQSEVDLEFRRAFGEKEFTEAQRTAAWQAALEQVIDRRLVLRYLESTKQAASSQDIDLVQAQFVNDLKTQGQTLTAHLRLVGTSLDDFRGALAWKLSWNKYLEQHLTEANLQKYLERHARDFDGTQLRVAHILLKLPEDADATLVLAAKVNAAAIKTKIAKGELTFAEAAQKHSQSPTASSGGDIGWIERHQPQPEVFSRAAFALKKGQVSEPVLSPFGVHLITVLDEKPGTKTWRDAEAELRPAVTLYLFRWIADKERAKAKVEYLQPAGATVTSQPAASSTPPLPR